MYDVREYQNSKENRAEVKNCEDLKIFSLRWEKNPHFFGCGSGVGVEPKTSAFIGKNSSPTPPPHHSQISVGGKLKNAPTVPE